MSDLPISSPLESKPTEHDSCIGHQNETQDSTNTALNADTKIGDRTCVRRCGRPRFKRTSHYFNSPISYSQLNHYANLTPQQLMEHAKKIPSELTLYDVCRTPRVLTTLEELALLDKKMTLSETGLTEDLSCPICMGTYQNVAVVKDCLHRFCGECIERWLRTGHQDCPKCRQKIPSRRSLRADPIFQRIICRLFPNVARFEALNDKTIAQVNHRRVGAPLYFSAEDSEVRASKRTRRSVVRYKSEDDC